MPLTLPLIDEKLVTPKDIKKGIANHHGGYIPKEQKEGLLEKT